MKIALSVLLALTTAVPALAQTTETPSTGYALFDMNISNYDFSKEDDNETDFQGGPVILPNGQARFRLGSFVGEIQGTYSMLVDEGDSDENEMSASFGMFGHYVMSTGKGESAVSLGTIGGGNTEDTSGQWYSTIGASYAQDGWMVGIGHLQRIGGDSVYTLKDFNYLQASNSIKLSEENSVFAAGYYGVGSANGKIYNGEDYVGTSSDVTGANIEIGAARKLSEQVVVSASVGRFVLENQASDQFDKANGYSVNLGLQIALGGNTKQAKDAIRFGTPDFHREVTWCKELECGIVYLPN